MLFATTRWRSRLTSPAATRRSASSSWITPTRPSCTEASPRRDNDGNRAVTLTLPILTAWFARTERPSKDIPALALPRRLSPGQPCRTARTSAIVFHPSMTRLRRRDGRDLSTPRLAWRSEVDALRSCVGRLHRDLGISLRAAPLSRTGRRLDLRQLDTADAGGGGPSVGRHSRTVSAWVQADGLPLDHTVAQDHNERV